MYSLCENNKVLLVFVYLHYTLILDVVSCKEKRKSSWLEYSLLKT